MGDMKFGCAVMQRVLGSMEGTQIKYHRSSTVANLIIPGRK
jgi:hypothetical protein